MHKPFGHSLCQQGCIHKLTVVTQALILVQAMGINVNDELEDGDPAFDAQPGDDAGEQGGQFTGHAGQVLTVGCWLTVKEIGLVVGTMARTLPLPAGSTNMPLPQLDPLM